MADIEIQRSDYRIRKLVGLLGLSLPFILPLAGGGVLSSISHYYYITLSSLFFIIILSTFALFLISYKGYKIDPISEKVSDDLVTNIGGFAALVVVFLPTRCLESGSAAIDAICSSGVYPLFGHDTSAIGIVHLVSAGVFIFTMGWMSKYKFTRSNNDVNNKIYKICGNIVWLSIGILIVLFSLEKLGYSLWITKYDVFILESLAVIPFGISWLIKGKVISHAKALKEKIMK